MEALTEKKCQACEGGVPPLASNEIREYKQQLKTEWEVTTDEKWIRKSFKFKNFKRTMDFANKITEIAESEQHHPDLYITFGKCIVYLSTHAIGGLSENDFIVAAKIEEIPEAGN